MKKYKSFQSQSEPTFTDLELAKISLDEAMGIFIEAKLKYTTALESLSESQHEYLVELEKHYESKTTKP